MSIRASRTNIVLRPDPSRVFFRPFDLMSQERITRIVARVTALERSEAEQEARIMLDRFMERHVKLEGFLLRRFEEVRDHVITDRPLNDWQKLLVGAYFTLEYSLEAAALFNPSIVPHPDQSGLSPGTLRFVLSLRATGEGHVSSIVFRTGVIDENGQISINPPTRFITAAEVHPNPSYEKRLFERKLRELGVLSRDAQHLMDQLDEQFTFEQLSAVADEGSRGIRLLDGSVGRTAENLLVVARANYEISFEPSDRYSERVIFPLAPAEARGIEDARFVRFHDEAGRSTYYATYTAFDGQVPLPQLLETEDFVRFKISTLNGPEVQNKGMALFPRKVAGHYAMLSRQDNENIYLMYSDMLHFWYDKHLLLRPTFPWEFVQLGNCGSPIETDAGWLVLTHGVGSIRRYAIGAVLLDLNNPGRVIGRLPEPLLEPIPEERDGYVPNVVYSCGALVHAGRLILPYAMSDQCTSFATVPLEELLSELKSQPPDSLL
ncbi:MAG TPA: glycoside hydrolase family 130 protein [Candidatus Acidoferrum sp.]|nr:glycoside hydrolase family 130 protein [Candidatus Acidoferrum sp.]